MKIGFVRRGYSPTGGAEAYLQRLAAALTQAGHSCLLFGSEHWPREQWPYGPQMAVRGNSPMAFARALQQLDPRQHCDYLLSLERLLECDCFRAGDGVHAAWLERRAVYEPYYKSLFRKLQGRHRQLLRLERSLFAGGARTVIANSKLVRDEITARFGYPAERIHVVYNGVPQRPLPERAAARAQLGLPDSTLAVAFVGSGWERKGLRFAIEAVRKAKLPQLRLLVAGRGNPRLFPSSEQLQFLGPLRDPLALLAAADLFILPTVYDPFSNACLEALAAGLPVFTTRANGCSEIIEPGIDGEVFDQPSDVDAMAQALHAWADASRREAARPRLTELGARFSMETNLANTLAAAGLAPSR